MNRDDLLGDLASLPAYESVGARVKKVEHRKSNNALGDSSMAFRRNSKGVGVLKSFREQARAM